MKRASYRQGIYKLRNPEKYLLDTKKYPVVYRSSWEKRFFEFMDNNPNVLTWAAEPFYIEYMKPYITKTGKQAVRKAKYYPDVFVEYRNKSGEIKREVIEIKPYKQTRKTRAKKATRRLQEEYTYQVNMAKWAAARKWCESRNLEFKIMTEKSIFK